MFTICYIDPGTGSMLISSIIAGLSVLFFALKDKIYSAFRGKGDKGDYLDLEKHYNLVYYSEGKQYWNVFEPLLIECSKRSIEGLYLTSDKEDPGLTSNIKGLTSIYIGTGKEAFYKLNNLKADMVIMTTPGLDVLEIKRSKNVSHYCHLSHATGSFGNYKSYSADYFDSVLIGGKGNYEIIRELEELRNLPKKEIEIIGNTYLDVYRKNLKEKKYEYSLFKKKKQTILISPTWGSHGLLASYGEKLLSSFDKVKDYNIIIRPHPQSLKSEKKLIDDLMNKYPNNENRIWDFERENLNAMYHADIMISDFSGIIYDFYSLFQKPILTFHSQFEKRGRDANDLKEDPWDITYLDKIGKTLYEKDIDNILNIVKTTIKDNKSNSSYKNQIKEITDMYPNQSGKLGANFIEKVLKEVSLKEEKSVLISSNSEKDDHLEVKSIKDFFKLPLNHRFLFQAVITSVLLLAYTFIGRKVLPKPGLNVDYLTALTPYLIIASLFVTLLFVLNIWILKKGRFTFNNHKEPLDKKDFAVLAMLFTPIIQYIILNTDILAFKDMIAVLLIFLIISIAFVLIVPLAISPIVSKKFTIPATLSFVFVIFNMASFSKTSSFKMITVVMLSILIIGFILYLLDKKKLVVIISITFLLVNIVSTVISKNKKDDEISFKDNSTLINAIKGKTAVKKVNVYLLIYDSYPNEETLKSYKYDNSDQFNYLLENGFAIYDGTYSIGCNSLMSMSQVLHVSPVRGMVSYREKVAGDADGLKIFRSLGYDTYFFNRGSYMTSGYEPQYTSFYPDTSLSIASYKIITTAILEGEFRFDVKFSEDTQEGYLKAKSNIFIEKNINPEFVYAHSNYPEHSQNSGVLLPNETELYIERLKIANKEMKKDLTDLNAKNSTDIIIIAGDHGPYLTKNGIGLSPDYKLKDVNRLDIQDRFGVLLAIHWPEEEYIDKYKIRILQDVLPAAFSYIYNDDSIFEEAKMSTEVVKSPVISGASIKDGVIIGGKDDGKDLFKTVGIRKPITR